MINGRVNIRIVAGMAPLHDWLRIGPGWFPLARHIIDRLGANNPHHNPVTFLTGADGSMMYLMDPKGDWIGDGYMGPYREMSEVSILTCDQCGSTDPDVAARRFEGRGYYRTRCDRCKGVPPG